MAVTKLNFEKTQPVETNWLYNAQPVYEISDYFSNPLKTFI